MKTHQKFHLLSSSVLDKNPLEFKKKNIKWLFTSIVFNHPNFLSQIMTILCVFKSLFIDSGSDSLKRAKSTLILNLVLSKSQTCHHLLNATWLFWLKEKDVYGALLQTKVKGHFVIWYGLNLEFTKLIAILNWIWQANKRPPLYHQRTNNVLFQIKSQIASCAFFVKDTVFLVSLAKEKSSPLRSFPFQTQLNPILRSKAKTSL